MRSRYLLLIVLLFQAAISSGQTFTWQAELEKVPKTGFYNILLSPDLVSKTRSPELADIRIFQGKDETGYLLRTRTDTIHQTPIPAPVLKVKDDKDTKQTILSLQFNAPYQINELELEIQGAKFYRRDAYLQVPNPDYKPRNRYNDPNIRLADFILKSGKPNKVQLDDLSRYQNLSIVIDNDDNTPLTIKGVKAYQRNMYLTAYLEKDKSYILKMGQAGLDFPKYDLAYFSDSISRTGPTLKVSNFKRNLPDPPVRKTIFSSKIWIWAALGILIVFVLYLSSRMIKDMQSRKS